MLRLRLEMHRRNLVFSTPIHQTYYLQTLKDISEVLGVHLFKEVLPGRCITIGNVSNYAEAFAPWFYELWLHQSGG